MLMAQAIVTIGATINMKNSLNLTPQERSALMVNVSSTILALIQDYAQKTLAAGAVPTLGGFAEIVQELQDRHTGIIEVPKQFQDPHDPTAQDQ